VDLDSRSLFNISNCKFSLYWSYNLIFNSSISFKCSLIVSFEIAYIAFIFLACSVEFFDASNICSIFCFNYSVYFFSFSFSWSVCSNFYLKLYCVIFLISLNSLTSYFNFSQFWHWIFANFSWHYFSIFFRCCSNNSS
jgi:hypothetical protein